MVMHPGSLNNRIDRCGSSNQRRETSTNSRSRGQLHLSATHNARMSGLKTKSHSVTTMRAGCIFRAKKYIQRVNRDLLHWK